MSLSSSRRSSKMREDGEFYLECKAAFLTEYDDINDKIESRNKLVSLLQTTGRNPTRATLNRYWSNSTNSLSFNDFVDICNKEPVTTADDLMKAFRRIDINGDGYISFDELFKIMNKKEEGMSRAEVRRMIDEVDDNKDGRLDYREVLNYRSDRLYYEEFTNMVMKTTEDSKKMSKKMMERKERKKKRGELSAAQSDTSIIPAPQNTQESLKSESQISVQSMNKKSVREDSDPLHQESMENFTKHDLSGSRSSVRSERRESITSNKDRNNQNKQGSSLSLQKENNEMMKSSTVSLQSESQAKMEDDVNSSKISLENSKSDKVSESKVSIRAACRESKMGSRASLRKVSEQGLEVPLAQEGQESLDIKHDSARSVGEDLDYDDDHDIMSSGRPTPRISLSSRTDTSKIESPKTETPKSAKNGSPKQSEDAKKGEKDDTETGSQSSLRSGDKDAGVPVPSPRKSVKGVTEDDIPRPSPRVRNSKTKSPSSSLRSKDKLPDPRSLQDWKNCTSKGCFFYEEDEIVTHVYNLRLQDDSTVYLSAAPISEPACLNLPGSEPIDTALYVLDSRGSVVAFTEQRDVQGTFGVKVDLEAGEYQIVPYTTGCRFKKRGEMSSHMKEARLVKKDKDDKILITSAFRKALDDIFDLCDLDGNGTMSRDEFNWFNLRTSGEELGDEEWDVVEERTDLENGEISRSGFIKLNEMEAEDAEGDVDDLWITLTSMGMNKSLIMDEACPYRLNVYVKDVRRKQPRLTVTGIESLEKREFVAGICQFLIEKAGEPTSIRRMKDLYLYTYKNDYTATMVIDNRSRSTVQLEIDCSKSRNVVSNRSGLDHTFEIDPQQTAIAHHLMPKSELSDWSVVSTETIHK